MYCKQCGRKLRGEARFCDHCGSSTKGMTGNKKTSGTSGLRGSGVKSSSDSRAKNEYERNKRKRELEKAKVRKNRKIVLILILFAILASIALGFAAFKLMEKEIAKNEQVENLESGGGKIEDVIENKTQAKNSKSQKNAKPDVSETAKPTATPIDDNQEDLTSEPTPEPSAEPTKEPEKTEEEKEKEKEAELEAQFASVASNCNIYKHDRLEDIKCPYPKNFEQSSKSNTNTVLSLMDFENDGIMMICSEDVVKSASGSALAKDYADGLGDSATILSNYSGNDGYEISFERNNRINHRKAIIIDNLCVYYDFSYDFDSSKKSEYDEYIEYINYYLDKQAKSFAEQDNEEE